MIEQRIRFPIYRILSILTLPIVLCFHGLDGLGAEEEEGGDESKAGNEKKNERPDHNVILNEEDEVNRLLDKAQKSREKAKEDPQFWPDCVKAYSGILQKYPQTVFLFGWDDGQKENRAYGKGVYRSTSEKVAEELATLPAEGLAIYKAINDPAARGLLMEAMEAIDDRKMEQVAQTFFSTSWGDDALHWLGELAYNRGSYRQAASRFMRIDKHPEISVSKSAIQARLFLAQIKSHQFSDAEQTLKKLRDLVEKEGNPKDFRIGHLTGQEALAHLGKKLQKGPETAETARAESGLAWETFFGNAQHFQTILTKKDIGVRKWSKPIISLLGGTPAPPSNSSAQQVRQDRWGRTFVVPKMMDTHIVARGRYFFICGDMVLACHSITNPEPKRPQFRYPDQAPQASSSPDLRNNYYGQYTSQHPLFCTLGGDHVFVALGPPPVTQFPGNWGENAPKQQPNWIVARGKRKGGQLGVEAGLLLWTLEPGTDPGYRINSKADQEWLKDHYIASTPTYDAGALFATAVSSSGGTCESWAIAIDASTGRLLWKTLVCSSQAAFFSGPVQPAIGLPVAVSGGTVYTISNLGAVAALEGATGAVKWIRIYDRDPNLNTQQAGWGRQEGAGSKDFWSPTPPIIVDNMLIAAPQDSHRMYAFDTHTGRRLWHIDRVDNPSAPGDAERLKHVLGITNGRLVISGSNVVFIKLKGGLMEYKVPLRDQYAIQGRGVVTENMVLVPTETHLIMVDTSLGQSGKPIYKLAKAQAWEEPEKEAGNLFIAGDVLFSVSESHVNAYFDLASVEKKLNDRIAANPKDLEAYLELGDVRHRAEKYPEAIAAYNQGLKVVEGIKDDPQSKKWTSSIRGQKFETLYKTGTIAASGETPDQAVAHKAFQEALDSASDAEQSVRALWKMAETAHALKRVEHAVLLYHRLLVEFGETVYAFEANSSFKAAVYAERKIGEIAGEDPASMNKLSAMAKTALDKALAEKKPETLSQTLTQYPHTVAHQDGLYALANLYIEQGKPEEARKHYKNFIIRYSKSPKLAEARARLALAYEALGMLGPAKISLAKLVNDPTLKTAMIECPGQAPVAAETWAANRLTEAKFKAPSEVSIRDLGNGKLMESWTQNISNNVVPIDPSGQASPVMQRQIVYLDQGRDIVVRSGFSGEMLWNNPVAAPAGFSGAQSACAWSGKLLVVAGKEKIIGIQTENGEVAWTFPLNPNNLSGGGAVTSLQAIDGFIVIAQAGGQTTALDATTGKDLWRVLTDQGGIHGQPALGFGIVAIATPSNNPNKISVYGLDAGVLNYQLDDLGSGLTQPPVAKDELIFAGCKDNVLRAFDSGSGKLIWSYELGESLVHLQASDDRVYAVLNTLQIVALESSTPSTAKKPLWITLHPDDSGVFYGMVPDGNRVFLGAVRTGKPGSIFAYRAEGGKFEWKADIASSTGRGEQDKALPVDNSNLAKGHILTTRGSYDPQGRQISVAGLVNRETGKLDWAVDLSSDRRFGFFLYCGGVVIGDGRRLTGYVSQDPDRAQKELADLRKEVAAKPTNVKLKIQLAQLQYEQAQNDKFKDDQASKAITTLEEVLSDPTIDEETFAIAFEKMAKFRRNTSGMLKRTIPFVLKTKAPTIDGNLDDWADVKGIQLDSWGDLFLAGEQDRRQLFRKADWTGAKDLSVTFKGAYDQENLYLAFEVVDDTHANPNDSAVDLWNGDSIQIAFDMERDTGMRFLGNDFELGLARATQGALLKWRWVEKGNYIMKALEEPAAVTRDQANGKTLYELALPLGYLDIKPVEGLKFGFTWVANDLDAGDHVSKGMGPSPGIWNPKFPGRYAVGELSQKAQK